MVRYSFSLLDSNSLERTKFSYGAFLNRGVDPSEGYLSGRLLQWLRRQDQKRSRGLL